jgi:hypothetical protein
LLDANENAPARTPLGRAAAKRRAVPDLVSLVERVDQVEPKVDRLATKALRVDFYDLWAIAGAFDFEDAILTRAIETTFGRRQTPLPQETPAALTQAYAEEKAAQWAAFLRRTELAAAPEPFPAIQTQIAELVMPPTLCWAGARHSRLIGSGPGHGGIGNDGCLQGDRGRSR